MATSENELIDRALRARRESLDRWDDRFLKLAELVAGWSKDPSTKVGAVIVRPDRSVASLGYNGFPRAMPDFQALYDNREEKYSRIVHGEINALISAGSSVQGCTLYTWPFGPCDRCAVQVIQAGIKRVVYPALSDELAKRWGPAIARTQSFFEECGVEYRTWSREF